MALLDAEDQHVAIDEYGHESVSPINVFAAYILQRKNWHARRKAVCPGTERFCFFRPAQRLRAVRARSCRLAFEEIFNEAFER